ncbi:MAG TPA: GNAT family protein [Natrialbaceae archaeon]|nr:GNAT family protein [Natrialbaceae archaeon]
MTDHDLFPETIETDRLRLRKLDRETVDTLDLYEITGRSETIDEETRYLTMEPHDTPKDARDMIAGAAEQWADAESAIYAIRAQEGEDGAGQLAGTTNLAILWDRREARPGIMLRKPFWGRGYSGERAMALMKLAFDRLDLEIFSPAHFDGNENSRRAIEKYVDRVGGRYEGVLRNWVPDGDEVHDLHRYSVSQEEWQANRPEDLAVEFIDEGGVGSD